MKRNIIFYDLETTGMISPNVKIIEISAIKVDPDTLEEIDNIYFKCNNDGTPIEPDATEKHGIKEEDLIGFPTFREVASTVFDFFKDCDLGGYNCTYFDNPVLYNSFLSSNILWDYRDLKIYDVFTLYKKYHSGKLEEVYKLYTGKSLEHAHEAEADIRATLEIYKQQRNENQEFEPDELTIYKDNLDIAGNFKIRVNKDNVREVYVNFGKYKGQSIDKVDTNYLKWVSENTDGFQIDTRTVAKKILKYRENEKKMNQI